MAALRHGVKTVIIPQDNEKDLEEIDQTVRRALQFITVRQADAVLETALNLPKNEQIIQTSVEPAPLPLPAAPVKPRKRKPDIRQ